MLVAAIASACLLLGLVLFVYEDSFYRRVAPIAFLIHLAFGLVVVPALPYVWDVGYFHTTAVDLLEGADPDASDTVIAFATFQAFLYLVFEPSVSVLAVFNALFAVLVPIPASYVARRLYPSTTSTDGITLLVLFLPLPAFFTSVPMRDAFVLLVAFVSLALLVRGLLDQSIRSLTLAVPLLGVLYLTRVELALLFVLGAVAGAGTWVVLESTDREISTTTVVGLVLPVLVLGPALFSRYFPLGSVNYQRRIRMSGGAVYLEGLTYESWIDVVLSGPATSIYFQFAPFPLHVDSLFHFAAAAYTPIVIVLAVSAVRSLRRGNLAYPVATMLVVVYLAGVAGYGLVNSNFGTTVRHRMFFDFLLVVLAAPVVERWERSVSERIGEWPREHDDEDEQGGEARKLYARRQIGTEDENNAHHDGN
ncbi:hypothetical protein [Natronobeatus ordinarius]|uniref:hypothetical protein n=1 Tax=Natronobeatus ordinarius TaxID=2963433 RepID=UPI0020CE1F25|nr:hypothetical protein [Natronobeatus ordinarius]